MELRFLLMVPLWGEAQPILLDLPGTPEVLVYQISGREAARLFSSRKPVIRDKYLPGSISGKR